MDMRGVKRDSLGHPIALEDEDVPKGQLTSTANPVISSENTTGTRSTIDDTNAALNTNSEQPPNPSRPYGAYIDELGAPPSISDSQDSGFTTRSQHSSDIDDLPDLTSSRYTRTVHCLHCSAPLSFQCACTIDCSCLQQAEAEHYTTCLSYRSNGSRSRSTNNTSCWRAT